MILSKRLAQKLNHRFFDRDAATSTTIKIVGIGGLGLEVIKDLLMEKKNNGKIGDFLSDQAC